MSNRRPRREFTEQFKEQCVNLYNARKPRAEIIKEYHLTSSVFSKWIVQSKNTGSFVEADNFSDEKKALLKLEKENKQLRMENDILKQCALIMGESKSHYCK